MKSAADLQAEWGMDGVTITDRVAGFPVIDIVNAHATARIALNGGHVMTFQPVGEKPLLWVSETSRLEAGKPIRGGIPVCWPWFANHATDASLPAHGVVRTRFWTLTSVQATAEGETVVVLTIGDDEQTRALWDHAFQLELTVTVGAALTAALKMTNTGAAGWDCEAALHSYFSVGDIAQVAVRGLEGVGYVDKVRANERFVQAGEIRIAEEVDRIYQPTESEVVVEDGAWGRQIVTTKKGSGTTVVWNPWIQKGRALGDFQPEGHLTMICVETARVGEDRVRLEPGESATMQAMHALR